VIVGTRVFSDSILANLERNLGLRMLGYDSIYLDLVAIYLEDAFLLAAQMKIDLLY
jgi:hypothetical protein